MARLCYYAGMPYHECRPCESDYGIEPKALSENDFFFIKYYTEGSH